MRNIAIVTGSRGEYGYIKPVIRAIDADPDLSYSVIATNLHMLADFGDSISQFEKDNIRIADRIFMALDGYTPTSMSKSMGVFMLGVTDSLARIRPDILLLAGDRGEQLMAAFAAAHMNIPIAHIQAGELSGNIDGMTRHAITRFTHLHFASGEDAATRLARMGEEEFRIHMTGAPQLDDLINGDFSSPEEIAGIFRLDLKRPVVLFVQHSVTGEFDAAANQVAETLEAICELGHQTVCVFPNNDAGSAEIRRIIERYHRPFIRVERNLPRELYAGLMNVASAMVGNSSSGLIEAPCFKLPAINIGSRQRDRHRGNNIIDVAPERTAILEGMRKALSTDFRNALDKHCENPYLGDGNVSARIVDILKNVPIDDKLLMKQIAY